MILNVKLLTKIIALLRSSKVTKANFDFDDLNSGGDCGCAVHHAHKAGLLEFGDKTNHNELSMPFWDQEIIFGANCSERDEFFNGDSTEPKEVAQAMEDYIIAVKSGALEVKDNFGEAVTA